MFLKVIKFLASVLLGGVLAVAGYWYWSPLQTLYEMHSAVQNGDAQAFNQHVDYPKLRENLKKEYSDKLTKKMARHAEKHELFSYAGTALTRLIASPMIEAMVRPDAVMGAMKSGAFKLSGQEAASSSSSQDQPMQKTEWGCEHEGVNKFVVSFSEGKKPRNETTRLVLERRGFATWKLTEIRLPD
ncbi:MAG: DUF2939 domain-containing protein [Burkholderiaceae bacterium]|nr:DUF2939 domain-containing protein [Burkholderiaceae bacterium]